MIYRATRLAGRDHDSLAGTMARGFAGPGFFKKIRKQPSAPLLNLLEHRLRAFDQQQLDRRLELGELFERQLRSRIELGNIQIPGSRMQRFNYWVLPVLVGDPDTLMRDLWKAGFDATNRCSLSALNEQLEFAQGNDAKSVTRLILEQVVFLPLYSAMPDSEVERMARVVAVHARPATSRVRAPKSASQRSRTIAAPR